MPSIEEKVEEYYKKVLDNIGLRHFGKTEKINDSISNALKESVSKSGGSGNNFPDIQCLINNNKGRTIPVMIECKGGKNKLEKISKDGNIVGVTVWDKDSASHKKGDLNYSAVSGYAVNGALHYGRAILDGGIYGEVIIVGVNGTALDKNGIVTDPEYKAYYVSNKNHGVAKHMDKLDKEWLLFKPSETDRLLEYLDDMNLTDVEREKLIREKEATLEDRIHKIHQSIYDDERIKTTLTTNEKLYLFCGLIMAGLENDKVAKIEPEDFKGNNSENKNDGTIITEQIREFLDSKNCNPKKVNMVMDLVSTVFRNKVLWRPINGESILKSLFIQVKRDIIPCLESDLHLDFTGKILNKLSDWVTIENDAANDVVLTPRYVTSFMARLARTDKDSFVWDSAMGSAGFLVSAMEIMIRDAEKKCKTKEELEEKVRRIKEEQLLGTEILGNVYILAVLNMILMGDGSSNINQGDSLKDEDETRGNFPANVFLLNPPYSAPGKGFIFVEKALKTMTSGWACVLIQENAGSGQGLPYTKRILENNTLVASIHMPSDLFSGKASVQPAIYLFNVERPHDPEDIVTFIDMSEDGYSRQNRKKSNINVNLRDVDNATGRYAEVEAIILNKKKNTDYYNETNGKVIRDTISLNGNDWTYQNHRKIDITPTTEDFKKTVADYLSFRVTQILKGRVNVNE